MRIVHNSNSTMHQPVLGQIAVARAAGCDGVFLRAEHIRRYLAAGLAIEDLVSALNGLAPINLGALPDVDRRGSAGRAALLEEARALTELAVAVGAHNIQVLTGPLDPTRPYSEPNGGAAEQRRAAADGLRAVSDIGAAAGIRYYLEPIAWTLLSTLDAAVEVIDEVARDNVGLVLDYWHLWHRGTDPENLARLDPRVISGVDFGDSLGPRGDCGTDQRTRRVWPGEGEIPLAEWTRAIQSTGFDGWWDNELYSPPHWELDARDVGVRLAAELRETVAAAAERTLTP